MNNNLRLQGAIEEIAEGLKNMVVEDYETKVLCLNGSITTELFDRVMHEVIDREVLDDESIGYHEEDYLITRQDFMDVFHYIKKVTEPVDLADTMFPTAEVCFNYRGNSFLWSLLGLGQGFSCVLRTIDIGYGEYPEIKIDLEIKFYKRVKDE